MLVPLSETATAVTSNGQPMPAGLATGQNSTAIRLSGEGKDLELKRMTINNVVFDGFSRGLKVGNNVLIGDTVRIVNSDFAGAKHELDIPRGKVWIEEIDPG
jgi:hypothetical protein